MSTQVIFGAPITSSMCAVEAGVSRMSKESAKEVGSNSTGLWYLVDVGERGKGAALR